MSRLTQPPPHGRAACCDRRWHTAQVWSPDAGIGGRYFNARAETIATAAPFREAYKQRRCLIPATVFFEWTGEKGHKLKHRIRLPAAQPMALAGLWERWHDRDSDSTIESYTVITCPPSAQMAPVHHRMPVVVAPACYEAWLRAADPGVLRPYEDELLIDPPAPAPRDDAARTQPAGRARGARSTPSRASSTTTAKPAR